MTRDRVTYIGLNLGQAQDSTALVVTMRYRRGDDRSDQSLKPPYDVPYLHRFPHGTPYTTIVPFVVELLQTPELQGSLVLVDYTGSRSTTTLESRSLKAQAEHGQDTLGLFG